MTAYPEMSAAHMDILREISNIGIGNAITSLAQLINGQINMNVPIATFMSYDEIIALVGGPEELVSCVCISISGDLQGVILFIFNSKSTISLIDMLMDNNIGTTSAIDEMGSSAVMEVGNVLSGSFLNAIYQMTKLDLHSSVPMFAYDMLGAVLASIIVASGKVEEKVLVFETRLFNELAGAYISGHFFMLTEPGSIDILINALS